jgi:DNA-directed RNA polymerase specialized sigma24 family protein
LDSTTQDLLEKEDWDRIILRLTDHAVKKARWYGWRMGKSAETVIGGTSPEDVVLEAISKVFDGDRRWDPSENPDLFQYIKSVVDSLMNHLTKSFDCTNIRRMPQSEEGEILEEMLKPADPESDTARHLSRPSPNPEQILLRKEQEEAEQKAFDKLMESIKGDDDLETVILCVMDGMMKPAEIAEATGFEINHVYQLMRKLNRKAAKISDIIKVEGN